MRRRSHHPRAPVRTDVTVLAVHVDDRPPVPAPAPAARAAEWAALRRLVAEAVILQDAADELLAALRRRPDPSEVARPCGRLKARFVELRESLPEGGDGELDRYAAALRQVFDHHVLLLNTSLGLLAAAQRNEVLDTRVDDVAGLGAPARRLEAIRLELLRREAAGAPAATHPV